MTVHDNDPTPSAQELLEAEALARALEGDGSAEALPQDALATAALLQYGQSGAVLPSDRHDAILQEIQDLARSRRTRAPSRGRSWRWLWAPAGGLVAAAGTFALVFALLGPFDRLSPTILPAPSQSLLEAQAGAASGRSDAYAALQTQMQLYRGNLYSVLSERYQGTE
jgi:hypothetical protein